MRFDKKGFTLVEIVIVVGIIGLLSALALPNFLRMRDIAVKNICISNLRMIRDNVQIWAVDESKVTGDTPVMDDLVPDYIRSWPSCGGTPYDIPSVGQNPVCPKGIADHTL